MVRLINKNNVFIVKELINGYMQWQKTRTHIYNVNNKGITPCIYVMWHHDQFCVYGVPDRENTNILISNSSDGDLVAYSCEGLGFKIIRGSSGRQGAVESTFKMIESLEKGECIAIMVDGPHGPLHKVKNGAIRLAKMSGAPIVPMGWYCKQWNFITLPSWDNMSMPIGHNNIVNLYGEPIYVPKDFPQERESEIRQKIKDSLDDIHKRLPDIYKDAKKNNVWKKNNL